MGMEVSRVRFMCRTHNVPLKVCGNERIFYPTYTIPLKDGEDELSVRMDEEGWLTFDTSELYCPSMDDVHDDEEYDGAKWCNQDWYIEVE